MSKIPALISLNSRDVIIFFLFYNDFVKDFLGILVLIELINSPKVGKRFKKEKKVD